MKLKILQQEFKLISNGQKKMREEEEGIFGVFGMNLYTGNLKSPQLIN